MKDGLPLRIASRIDALNDLIGRAIHWLVLAMVVVGSLTALARYSARWLGLTVNLTPATEAQWYMFSVVFLLGAGYALRHDVHVRVDVLYERVGSRARAWIDLLGTFVFLVPFSAMMLWVSFPAVQSSWRIREGSPDPGGLPRWPIKALILASFALLLLQAFSQVARHVAEIRGGATDDAPREPEAHV